MSEGTDESYLRVKFWILQIYSEKWSPTQLDINS